MRLFYLEYSISQTVFAELKSANLIHSIEPPTFKFSWSHYLTLISIKNIDERTFTKGRADSLSGAANAAVDVAFQKRMKDYDDKAKSN